MCTVKYCNSILIPFLLTHHTVTFEVQAVIVTSIDESTLDVRCLFIPGSDAVGCYVALVSDQTNVKSENATLLRQPHALYASGHLNLTHKTHCYDRLLAFNIDVNNATSNFTIERELLQKANVTCSGNNIIVVYSHSKLIVHY